MRGRPSGTMVGAALRKAAEPLKSKEVPPNG